MKVQTECAVCLIHRGLQQVIAATEDVKLQFKAIREILDFLSKNFKSTATPAWLGTQRDRIIKRVTGNPDPYARRKELSNRKALELLPFAKQFVNDGGTSYGRFRRACLCAIVGNVMEFDILGHQFNYNSIKMLIKKAESDLAIDQIEKTYELARSSERILFLADNAGEIIFDTLLLEELRKLNAYVILAVKGKPILNDATIKDVREMGIDKIVDEVITTGTDAVGLQLEECRDDFIHAYKSIDFVIAKGMGYLETISEMGRLRVPHAFLLRSKCKPVAKFLEVDVEKNIAIILSQ